MIKLIVNSTTGEQQELSIDETGGYYDLSRVVWDERIDGPLPDSIELGKMQRSGDSLVTLPDYIPEHAAWLAAQQQAETEHSNYEALRSEMLNDPEIVQIRALVRSGDSAGIRSHFTAKNVAQLAESCAKMATIVSTMNEGK